MSTEEPASPDFVPAEPSTRTLERRHLPLAVVTHEEFAEILEACRRKREGEDEAAVQRRQAILSRMHQAFFGSTIEECEE